MPTLISKLLLATISVSSLLFLPIGGCRSEYESRSYISQYTIIDKIHIRGPYINNNDSSLFFTIRFLSDNQVSVASKGEDKKLYDNICTINGDTSYYGTVQKDGVFISGGVAFYPNISDVNIICSIDFDTEHPAGTSLNDCFEIEYSHYVRFNENGVVQKRIKLSEIKEIKCLALRECDIYYIAPPTSKQMATITLTITMDNGEVHENKFHGMI